MTPPRVAVVGGGLAGLAAAVRLAERGADVQVLDPKPPGGKARTLRLREDWVVESGPHSFTHRAASVFAFAEALGVADQVVKLGKAAGDRYLVRDGRLRRVGVLGGAIRLAEWWGVVRGLVRRVETVAGETVHDWFARRFGESFARGPLDAMMTGIWAASPGEIEMEAAFPALVAAEREHGTLWKVLRRRDPPARPAGTYTFAAGVGVLADAAVARLGRARFLPVACDEVRPGRVRAAGQELHADGVVVALDAPEAARLLPGVAGLLEGIRYSPLAVAHWISPDARFPTGFGWLAPHAEGRPMLGTICASDLLPHRFPAGHRGFTTMFGGTRHPEDAAIDEATARARIEAEHASLLPHAVGQAPCSAGGGSLTITALHLVHHPRAVAIPGPGHRERVRRVIDVLPSGVTVAGAWCGAGAMHDAISSGLAAADRVWTAVEASRAA